MRFKNFLYCVIGIISNIYSDVFPALDVSQSSECWGIEYIVGCKFEDNKEFNNALYSFKRSEFLMKADKESMFNLAIKYHKFMCFYNIKDINSAIAEGEYILDILENNKELKKRFPVYPELLTCLYMIYRELGLISKKMNMFGSLKIHYPEYANKISKYEDIEKRDDKDILMAIKENSEIDSINIVDRWRACDNNSYLKIALPSYGNYIFKNYNQSAISLISDIISMVSIFKILNTKDYNTVFVPILLTSIYIRILQSYSIFNLINYKKKAIRNSAISKMIHDNKLDPKEMIKKSMH